MFHADDCVFETVEAPRGRPVLVEALGLRPRFLQPPWATWSELEAISVERVRVEAPRVIAPYTIRALLPLHSERGPIDYLCEVFAVSGAHALVRWTDGMIAGWVAVVPARLLAGKDAPSWRHTEAHGWIRDASGC